MSLHYILDGYNIVKHPLLTPSIDKKIKNCCNVILELVRIKKLCGSSNNKITVVFDGFSNAEELKRHYSNINVIFSKKDTADGVIKRIVESSSNPKNIMVVSDDKEIKFFVKDVGAQAIGVEEFINRHEKSKNLKKLRDETTEIKPELNHIQIAKINQELKRIWLR